MSSHEGSIASINRAMPKNIGRWQSIGPNTGLLDLWFGLRVWENFSHTLSPLPGPVAYYGSITLTLPFQGMWFIRFGAPRACSLRRPNFACMWCEYSCTFEFTWQIIVKIRYDTIKNTIISWFVCTVVQYIQTSPNNQYGRVCAVPVRPCVRGSYRTPQGINSSKHLFDPTPQSWAASGFWSEFNSMVCTLKKGSDRWVRIITFSESKKTTTKIKPLLWYLPRKAVRVGIL